ncbi:MAG: hypothetical protein H7832_13495 [Magnetococcus sp. DMHC-6]
MSILLLIDGLIQEGDGPLEHYAPTLGRLWSNGRSGHIFLPQRKFIPEEDIFFFDLFNKELPERQHQDLPLGFFAALGLDLQPDPTRSWGRLAFSHLRQQREQLLFVSPHRTGQTRAEIQRLAQDLAIELAIDGWTIHSSLNEHLLISYPNPLHIRTTPLPPLDGQSILEHLPRGSDNNVLQRLLISGQLLLARHPINLERQTQHRVTLNTPWIWGVGTGPTKSPGILQLPQHATCFTTEPVVAGLARFIGFDHVFLDDFHLDLTKLTEKIAQACHQGAVLVHLTEPALLGRHGLKTQRQESMLTLDRTFIAPLRQATAAAGQTLLVSTSYGLNPQGEGHTHPVPWLTASGRELTDKPRASFLAKLTPHQSPQNLSKPFELAQEWLR